MTRGRPFGPSTCGYASACSLFAIRSLWKSRGLAVLAIISLSAGLGLTAALSSVADAILFRPLTAAHPGEIVRVFTASAAQRFGFTSYPDFEDLRDNSRSTIMIAQTQILVAVASGRDSAAQVRMGLAVTPDYFDVLHVPAALGRTFRAEEARDAVVILANAFWKSQFGSDPRVIGRRIPLSGTPFTVIGVAAENFGLDRFAHEDFYVPIQVYDTGLLPSSGRPTEDRSRRYLNIYTRLRGRSTLGQARAEIAVIGARLAAEHPETNRGRRMITVTELDTRLNSDRTMPVLAALLIAVAALIFLIACANVAGLLLVRAEARATETAIQIALGATRARLFAESISVSLTIAIAGALFAFPIAWAATRVLETVATLPSDMRFTIAATPGVRVALVMLLAAGIAALVSGLAPLLIASESNALQTLKSQRSAGRGRWRDALVTMEVACAAALVACGISLAGAIGHAARIDPGYRTDHVLTLALDPAQVRYGEAQARAFYDRAVESVRKIAGVRDVALAQSAPLGFVGAQRMIEIAGEPERSALWINIVTPNYFDLLRIPLIAGRAFTDGDSPGAPPVAIVNEELARRCGLGAQFRMNGRMVRVIGVARTARYFAIGEAPRPFLYLPFSQNYASRMVLHVRTEGDPGAAAHAVVTEIHALDAAQPVSEVRPAGDYLTAGATFQARVALEFIAAAGLCGIALALAGLYGVVAQAAIARRREIAIRIALGARPRTITMMMLARAMRLAVAGTCAGSMIALCAQGWIAGLIPGAKGPAACLCGAAAVLALSLAATLIPAVRVSSVDPSACLRED